LTKLIINQLPFNSFIHLCFSYDVAIILSKCHWLIAPQVRKSGLTLFFLA